MHALSHLRIGTRLAAGFALVLLLSVISTSYALYSARVNAEATREMMENRWPRNVWYQTGMC